ncbi:succinate-semialdehyde dehydrogenase : Aldehyde dehydrogenase OS=Bacillus simplex GN=BN1180_01740 PE=4 SV=1: Aldedh: Aldedh [Gemmata massiliana]|uniref:Aldehyde dehydrogenase domain-containing protein n=1 Tax=Gemmata massiliana TaxID=1210884 RepID=A0A6P2CS88_9BACT|nr:aldehyde dehydrogenase family protein [Gemmata massiliana]VTR91809.1 succinate-semialdehyde dehydrogenase : Aldehyde dehydrogenase OS=Bacillus simplex GN=BN1180_01740 PE=4 SV=1: Aldedh: Aldedh [Gemmata massiliana]
MLFVLEVPAHSPRSFAALYSVGMTPFTTELALARRAQESWTKRSVRDRLRLVRNLRALIVERVADISAAIHADIARPAIEIIGSEILPCTSALKFLEKRAARILAPRRVSGWDCPVWLMGNRDTIHYRPWGVVGIIGTWNYPVHLNVGQIAFALVAGNAVLWKPSENTPRTTKVIHQLFNDAGFSPDLLQTLPHTREAGPQLTETDVDYMVFTGSDTVGRKLATRLGERLIPSTLELSGCDAMFVFADADIEMAAKGVWFGLTLNHGQTCVAVRRVFVQRAKYDALVAALKPLVERAAPMSLVMESQHTQASRLIQDAVKRGASVLGEPNSTEEPNPLTPFPKKEGGTEPSSALSPSPCSGPREALLTGPESKGGGVGEGLKPTLLLHTPADAAICREACFAPVAAVIPFDTAEDALAIANQSPFGLSASVFSADVAVAQEFAARVPSGSVVINDVLAPTAHPATPFGGRGASGWGVTQGPEGLLAMTVPQVVTVHKGTFRPHLDDAVNPDPATIDLLHGLIRLTHARRLRERLGGLWQMVRGIRKKRK